MVIEGSKILRAPRADVWRALNDPAFLQRAIPGCRTVTRISDSELALGLSAAVGPIKTSFDSRLTIGDVVEQHSYVLSGQGDAGPAGSATGTVRVVLDDVDGGTRLDYSAETQISGRVAQLGTRLIDSAARKFSEEFFANVARLLAPPASADARVPSADTLPGPAAPPATGASTAASDLAGLGWRLALGCAVGSCAGTLVAGLLR